MCRLTLAWILAKILQRNWIANLSWPDFTHWSGPSLMPTRLSAVRCRRVSLASLANCFLDLLFPTLWLAFPSYFRSPEISSPKSFVWFRAKTDKGIVLHSVTSALLFSKLELSLFCSYDESEEISISHITLFSRFNFYAFFWLHQLR